MTLCDKDKRKVSHIIPGYQATDFRNIVDVGPIHMHLRAEELKAGLEPACGKILDVQFWTTNTMRARHAFIKFSTDAEATTAFKTYTPPMWWSSSLRPRVVRFNYPQDLKNYKPRFMSLSDQGGLSSGPSLSFSTTSMRHSTSTSPSTTTPDTPVSTYSPEQPSRGLSCAKDNNRSITSLSARPRGTRSTVAPTRKGPSPDSKAIYRASVEVRGATPSKGEGHTQFGSTKASTKLVTSTQESGQIGESPCGSPSVRPSSNKRSNAGGDPLDILPADQSGQPSSGTGVGQETTQAQVEDGPSLKAKVAETKARVEELTATRETLDEELDELTSKKEKLQDEIAHYVKMKVDRSKSSFKTAPAQPSRSRWDPTPSKDAEGATSILSALFLLHSVVTSSTLQ